MTVPGSLYYVQYKQNDNSQCPRTTGWDEQNVRLCFQMKKHWRKRLMLFRVIARF